jgi:hypothetical protein
MIRDGPAAPLSGVIADGDILGALADGGVRGRAAGLCADA